MNESNDFIKKSKIDYFVAASAKVTRSHNTLKNLDLSILKSVDKKILEDKKTTQNKIVDYYEKSLFSKIYSLLIDNFNIILYGLGSKRNVLEAFKDKWLSDEKFLKISGYFLELNLKIILIKLSKLFNLTNGTTNEEDFFAQATKLNDDIYLVIHSMDILFKTDSKIKNFFINLYDKCNGKLHIIATVDHINSALMFDSKECQKLNFICFETTTYENFDLERGYISSTNANKYNKSLMNLDQETLTINSIYNVYQSLPPNSRKVLLIIFKEWLEYEEINKLSKKSTFKENDDNKGLNFDKIFQKCKEEFLCTTRPTFRHQLGELKDHNLAKTIKAEGIDYLVVLIEDNIVKKFLNEVEILDQN